MSAARLKVTSAQSQPLNCLISLKVGSTFLRNLIWTLDHGTQYSSDKRAFPTDIASREMTRAELVSEVSFFVLRDPIERFFSLYFDKVLGPEETRFSWIPETLKANRIFHDGPELSLPQHRENCVSLSQFIKARLRGRADGPINPHWNTQFRRTEIAIKFGLQPLILDRLEPQLLQIANGRISGLETAMAMVNSRNHAPRVVSAHDILTPDLYENIANLYPEDIQLYDLVKTGWEVLGHPPEINL